VNLIDTTVSIGGCLGTRAPVCEGCAALLRALKSAPYDVRTYFAHQSSTSVAMKL